MAEGGQARLSWRKSPCQPRRNPRIQQRWAVHRHRPFHPGRSRPAVAPPRSRSRSAVTKSPVALGDLAFRQDSASICSVSNPEPFFITQQVRPRHCDAQAMVYAGRYHEFCEDAFLAWLDHVHLPYRSLRAMDVDLVISEARYRYHRPARLDDRLLIAVSCDPTADSELSANFEIRTQDHVAATAAITYVAVRGGRRCPLPDELRRAAARSGPVLQIFEANRVGAGALLTTARCGTTRGQARTAHGAATPGATSRRVRARLRGRVRRDRRP
jgi:YbgC/YbaW family acyl-CoA thioester hydrolase